MIIFLKTEKKSDLPIFSPYEDLLLTVNIKNRYNSIPEKNEVFSDMRSMVNLVCLYSVNNA